VIICGAFPPARTFDLLRSRGQYPGATGDALLSAQGAQLKDLPKPIAGKAGDFISRDDERLFEFVDTLRVSVKAKVAAEQLRGLSLSEIVAQVREMTRLAEQDARDPKPFSSSGFRAISKQAVAWCMEAYQPTAFIEEQADSAILREPTPGGVPSPIAASPNRFTKSHQPTRGLP
jgi:hypothetical protein